MKTTVLESFLSKVAGLQAYFEEYLRRAASITMFTLYRIGFYNVKTIRCNGNRIRHTTLCFH